jgi:hypothetical protein
MQQKGGIHRARFCHTFLQTFSGSTNLQGGFMIAFARKGWYLPILLCFVVLFAFALVSPVSADDGQPVDPPVVEEVTAPPPAEGLIQAPNSNGEVTPEDELPQDAPLPVETPAPLPTRDTSLGVKPGDPTFNVGSTTYSFTHADCDPDTPGAQGCPDPIQAALNYMADHNLTPTDRKLYIESVNPTGDDYTEDVVVDGSRNGVKGLLSLVGTGSTPEDVQINGSISVSGMVGGFSLNRLTVFSNIPDGNAIEMYDNGGTLSLVDVNVTNTATDGTGIFIYHTSTIDLNRVSSNNNGYLGARIYGNGAVKINNSEFNNNLSNVNDGVPGFDDEYDENGDPTGFTNPFYASVSISTAGPVTLTGVMASDNLGDGVDISAWNSIVTIKNSIFDNNNRDGVVDFWGDGIWIDGNSVSMENVQTSGNHLRGVMAYAKTAFNGNQIHAEGNGDSGFEVNTCWDWDDGDDLCDNPGTGTVSIKNSHAYNNGSHGFDVYSKGAVTFMDDWSGYNGGNAYYLDTIDALAPAAITVTNAQAFGSQNGFFVESKGLVTLTNFTANDNQNFGVAIVHPGTAAVTLTNLGDVFNQTSGNGGDGFNIFTLGPVTVINIDSSNNRGFGGSINNAAAASAATVTVKVMVPSSTQNSFRNNDLGGLSILSKGAVMINNTEASSNSVNYHTINNDEKWSDNMNDDQTWFFTASTDDDVTIVVESPDFNPQIDVFDSDWNFIGNMFGNEGTATLNLEDLAAGEYFIKLYTDYGWNGGSYSIGYCVNSSCDGTWTMVEEYSPGILVNNMPGTNAAVTITNPYRIWNNNNFSPNFDIASNGAVTISNVALNDSSDHGLMILNAASTTTPGVTLTSVEINENEEGGAMILSKGTVTINNIDVYQNNGNGLDIDNTPGTAGVTIGVSGTTAGNSISDNAGNGLMILSDGAVTITNLDANNNGGSGISVNNSSGLGAVTIKESGRWGNFYSGNGQYGLLVVSRGAVNVTFRQANDNGQGGILIDAALGTGAVTLTGGGNGADATNNGQAGSYNGVTIISKGNITVTKVTATNNTSYGANLTNIGGTGGVTLTSAYFDGNDSGLTIITNGAVVWKYGSASGNFNGGALIINSNSSLPYKPVTLTEVYTGNNGYIGLMIDTKGTVLLTDVESNNNSANYYKINNHDLWLDNMSENQTWFFDGVEGQEVTITVSSTNFNPSAQVLDSNWNQIGYADGSMGTFNLTITIPDDGDLDPGETAEYRIQLYTDQGWPGYGYEISFINDGIASFSTQESTANGILIYNHNGVNAPVTITSTRYLYSGNNSGTNIVVVSSGNVSISNMDLNDSRQDGLYISNVIPLTATPGVTISNVGLFNNDRDGANILSDGAVVFKGVNAGQNNRYGIYIVNAGGTAPVTMTGLNIDNSGDKGLTVVSSGAVSFTDVFSRNSNGEGISILTDGAVTFKNVTAENNNGFGAYVNTAGSFTTIQPTTGWNYFSNNVSDGLYVVASDKITLAKVRSERNGRRNGDGSISEYANGIFLTNASNGTGLVPVVLTNVVAMDNTVRGIEVFTTSAITVTNIEARNNAITGLALNQGSGPAVAPAVTLTQVFATGNGFDGVYVEVRGNIIVTKIDASGNSGGGAVLMNHAGTGTVTILNTKGMNFASFNGGVGMDIRSRGAVTVTGIETAGNGQDGLVIRNEGAALPAAVTVTSHYARNNGSRDNDGNTIFAANGLYIRSLGNITVNSSWSYNNTQHGIAISSLGGNVTINNTTGIANNRAGILVDFTDITKTLKLTNSTWFGNLRRPVFGDRNLVTNVTPIIL